MALLKSSGLVGIQHHKENVGSILRGFAINAAEFLYRQMELNCSATVMLQLNKS